MKIVFLFLVFIINALFAETNQVVQDENQTLKQLISDYKIRVEIIDNANKNNIWFARHENYNIYKAKQAELESIREDVKKLKIKTDKDSLIKLDDMERRRDALESQIEQLSEFQNAPFSGLLKSPDIPPMPSISNPFAIFSGFSYIKKIKHDLEEYNKFSRDLEVLIGNLQEKEEMLERIIEFGNNSSFVNLQNNNRALIKEFESAYDIVLTSASVYERKINEAVTRASDAIENETKRTFFICTIIVSIILISFLLKFFSKHFMSANDKSYIINKVINITNITLIILILLFAYIENMTYLVAVLGFASAGIAIAMKDMFMNILGWMVITFGRSFSVGDRVKVHQDGFSYVGDIVDISLMRMTILEDVTLTTYLENKRAGRVVFIPNNLIFTNLISNYTHETLKTVWDGIYLTISFDSNYKKAMYIIKEITKKYSKGYTEIARKQLNQLRQKYNLKNTNVEPKIFSFIEPHGLTIHVWYMTNSYAALALRSTLSGEIIDAINKEEDIIIAYPTQTLNLRQAANVKHPHEIEEASE
ncbi:MAG: mechanosensitive ion channel family protein [Campylobacteraceae bacterium]|jgi:small-conductance mechanosensitive channel|nr:mechanosensitive ion channel family protein [Campylobacteraceae bacterium]